jgi:hypothetical protein
METIFVTEENIGGMEAWMPPDQMAELVPECITWGFLYGEGQRGQMTIWPNGRGAVEWGGDSHWGQWDDDRMVLILDDGVGIVDKDGRMIDHLAARLDRQLECPRPASGRQDDFAALDCILAGECGCEYGRHWERA